MLLIGFLPATMMIGGGMAFVLGPINSAALQHVPESDLGQANAGFNTLRFLGTALGVALAVAVLGSLDRPDLAESFRRSLFLLAGAMSISPLALLLWYPSDRPRRDPRDPVAWEVRPLASGPAAPSVAD